MYLSFTSLLSMVLFSSPLLLLLYFMTNSYKFILCIGSKLLLFCILLLTIRFLLPFEFPFMEVVRVTKYLPDINIFLKKTTVPFFNNLYVIDFIAGIWLLEIIILTVKTITSYLLFLYKINDFEDVEDSDLLHLLAEINTTHNNKYKFKLVYNSIISSPFIIKIKSPVIVIPKISLSNKDWYYVLSHEIAHYYHKDLIYKAIASLLSIIYWWNPLIYLIKKQIEKLIEIHIDSIVTKNYDDVQRLDYMDCLLMMLRICSKQHKIMNFTITFNGHKTSVISQRVNILVARMKGIRPALQIITVLTTIIITYLTCSYCFILEPYAVPEDVRNTSFVIDNYDDYYLVFKSNNVYDLYYKTNHLGTVDNIFDSKLKIYTMPKGDK